MSKLEKLNNPLFSKYAMSSKIMENIMGGGESTISSCTEYTCKDNCSDTVRSHYGDDGTLLLQTEHSTTIDCSF